MKERLTASASLRAQRPGTRSTRRLQKVSERLSKYGQYVSWNFCAVHQREGYLTSLEVCSLIQLPSVPARVAARPEACRTSWKQRPAPSPLPRAACARPYRDSSRDSCRDGSLLGGIGASWSRAEPKRAGRRAPPPTQTRPASRAVASRPACASTASGHIESETGSRGRPVLPVAGGASDGIAARAAAARRGPLTPLLPLLALGLPPLALMMPRLLGRGTA